MKHTKFTSDAETFELTIRRTDNGYGLKASGSSAGETIADFSIAGPFDELSSLLDRVKAGTVIEGELQELGERLFTSILPPSLGDHYIDSIGVVPSGKRLGLNELYRESIGAARKTGQRLSFRLHVEPEELAGLPWEILYDKQDQAFLALSDLFTFARTITVPEPARDIPIDTSLRVMVLAAGSTESKTGAALDTAGEILAIHSAFAEKIQAGDVFLEVAQYLGIDSIRDRLKAFSPHVLHIIGHAKHLDDKSVLFLEDPSGSPYAVGEEQLRDLIGSATALHLVVLNACDSATSGQVQGLSGLAQRLLQRQVPGVVAMQAPVGDAAAIAFASTLYASLAVGETVEEAVTSARQRLADRGSPPSADWLIPVLFARTQLGSLFPAEEKAEESSSVLVRTWKHIAEIADVLGVIGIITSLPTFLTWLHGVWGPFSCVPDNRLWGWTTVGLLMLVPPVAWVHWKQALGIRKRWLFVLEVCLVLVLVLGGMRSVRGTPQLPVLSGDAFNIVVTTFGEGGRYTVIDGRQQIWGNFVCNSVDGLEFTNELLIRLHQTLGITGSVAPKIYLESLPRYIHSQNEAVEVAKAMNATVLVWGWFLASDTNSFEPQFVVNDPNEAWEPARLLTGLTSTQSRPDQVGLTQSRIGILTDFILGIFSMQHENVGRAQQYFQRSLDTVMREKDGTGLLPLLYYYTGRMDNHLGNSSVADAKFDAGLKINQEYAILHLNKGNILYEQARQKMDDPIRSFILLDQAEKRYRRALVSLEKESTQFVDGKASHSLGRVEFLRGQIDRSQPLYFKNALERFEEATQLFTEAGAPGCNIELVEISKAFVYEERQDFPSAKIIYESTVTNSSPCTGLVAIAKERLSVLGGSN